MPTCKLCDTSFPNRVKIQGITKVLGGRKYCLSCSPYGEKNRRKLENLSRCQKRTENRKDKKEILCKMFGGKCAVCDYDRSLRSLSFHHVEPKTKRFNICSNMTRKMQDLIAEAEKCILVCNNCHAEIHEGTILICL